MGQVGLKRKDQGNQRRITVYFFFLELSFLSQYNCFTLSCQFLVYNRVDQLYAYIYPLPLGHLSHPIPHTNHLGHCRTELTVLYCRFPLAIYFTHDSHLQGYGWTQSLSYRAKSETEKQILFIDTCMQNLDNRTEEIRYREGIDVQIQRTDVRTQGERGRWETEFDVNTLPRAYFLNQLTSQSAIVIHLIIFIIQQVLSQVLPIKSKFKNETIFAL